MAIDADAMVRIAELQRKELKTLGLEKVQNEVELPLVAVLVEIERNGLKLDADALAKVASGFERRDRAAREGHLRAGRSPVHDRLAEAARSDPL